MKQDDIDSATPHAVEVLVDGPFAASTLLWRAQGGDLRCSIVAKTTYALLPNVSPVVDPSEPIATEDALWDGAPGRSVRVPSDLAPFKHAPEVILVGHAYAPGRRPQRRLGVRLVIGDLDQALEVFPPRRFLPDGTLEEPSGARMPLAYEHAAGGPGTDNPVGIDMGLADAWGRRSAPSVLPLATSCEHPDDVVPLAGWGPIAPTWPSRARRLRDEDRAWLADPAGAPMPVGFDVRYFQSAPPSHWLAGPLRADERLVLENLSPAHERLVTRLEGAAPYASILGSKDLRIPLIADTLFIDTDRAIVTLTWRGLVMVDPRSPRPILAIARAEGGLSAAPPVFRSPPRPMLADIAAQRRVLTTIAATAEMRVAVVTPYAGEPEHQLVQCHESVAGQTYPCTHILVADGSPAPIASTFRAQHIILPQRHDDCGDTPRAIGAMSAIAQGFDAIAFLDGDNWIAPDHIAAMLDLHAATGAQVCIAARTLHRIDGTLLRDHGEPCDGVDHVDTSCLFLTSAAFRMVPTWSLMPKRLHLIGDRLVWSTIQALGYKVAHATRPTVAYRTAFRVHYEEQGEAPPPGAKDNTTIRDALRWWRDLPHEDRRLVFRRLGLKV